MVKLKLSQDIIQQFRKELRGELIEPSDPQYDEVRALYNGMIDKPHCSSSKRG
jgi:hypothetical protein